MNGAVAIEPEADQPLDYDALYARYLASLVDELRGFRAAAPGLELWVPDEDPLTSLRNLLDAAATLGRPQLVLRISARTLSVLGSKQRLLSMAQAFGQARLVPDTDGGLLLEVRGLDAGGRGAAEARRAGAAPVLVSGTAEASRAAVAPASVAASSAPLDGVAAASPAAIETYRAALESAAAQATHRGPLAVPAGQVALRAAADGVALSLCVAPGTHHVLAARFDAEQELESGLLESLCRLIEGLPLLEAAEHGSLRLEAALRGAARRPVPGILLPESVHPLFQLARQLLSQALADYRRQTGFAEVHSRHDQRPRAGWLEASDVERRARLAGALAEALHARGLDPLRVSVESIRYDVRVELALDLPPELELGPLVLDLERALGAALDPRLELYVTERRDRNAKRRLAVLGEDV